MKLSQLMLAGDYLSYKGDWVTNTAYNVNECVTWTDGHLYQVIKAHTSSDTISPSNTEYYKAMTASEPTKYELDLSTSDGRNTLVSLSQAAKQGKRIVVIDGENTIYSISKAGNSSMYFENTQVIINSSDTPMAIKATIIYLTPSVAKYCYQQINIDGTFSNGDSSVGAVTVFISG